MATLSGSRTISSQAVQEWAEGSTTTSVGNAETARLLISVALGDGHLKEVSPTSALLCIGHSAKQRDYLEHKAAILNRALGCDNSVKSRKTHNNQNGKTYETCQWWTPSLPSLLGLRKLLYLDGRKVLSRPLLEYGGLQALAYYFMDDGSLYLRYRESQHTGVRQLRERHTTLAVCDVAEQCEMIADWIESLTGVRMFLKKHNTSVNKWILRADGRGAAGIIEAIGHLFPDCMQHKADLHYSTCGRGKAKWSEPQPPLVSGR
jgi:hypothetical protein